MSTFSKTVAHTSATSQAVVKLLGTTKNKSASNTAATGQSVVPLRSRTYNKSASNTSGTAQSVVVTRGRSKIVISTASATVAASAKKAKAQSVLSTAAATCTVVRAASTFNRSVTAGAQTWSGATYREALAGVYFFFPPAGPTMQVGLRNPKFGNVHTVHLQTVAKRSRNGMLYIFKRTPTYESFKLEFDRIDETRFQKLITFMKATAGQIIQYQDHKGVKWNGYLLTDPFELVNDHKGLNDVGSRVDWYTLSLQFEGSIA